MPKDKDTAKRPTLSAAMVGEAGGNVVGALNYGVIHSCSPFIHQVGASYPRSTAEKRYLRSC